MIRKKQSMSENNPSHIQPTGEATGFIPAPGNNGKPITVIGTAAIRETFDAKCIEQALNSRGAPGVTDLVLNPERLEMLRKTGASDGLYWGFKDGRTTEVQKVDSIDAMAEGDRLLKEFTVAKIKALG